MLYPDVIQDDEIYRHLQRIQEFLDSLNSEWLVVAIQILID
jgi:hypothetical protein